ncbi:MULTISPECIES: tRNA dihydrouridine synthase DusB [Prochlorococcus]|uniref:tRNA-dihydrouridine synthase n=1 Tax=Prochlorococcus marinus str. MIT 9116 TaxID=167544 RepID=A0A0A1ZR23_PROMR|nr:tRNA dihydrouridine synthase DusB [Prochlorococcus marinus]KGF90704.1 tRNA dihydrouridine synthase B [Prochlorococcus marinus str. MIT 9107]KGF90709.1 tRNA dihydrouridine synthase B [Prochlorococcus marinus str. MIT 9116]KGF93729.1 tRNA dihydrouridine synthase B [Prochlorococcus marinus str. MIT 9123]
MSPNIKLKGKGVTRIIKSKVMLSPLAGVTDNIFRRLVRKWAPDSLLFTEMVNATSLKKGYGTQKINQIDLEKGPVGVQIFDNRPYAVSEAAKQAEDFGAFLIDINMGCPVKKIAKKGGGSALIKDRKLATELVKEVVKAVKIPVTVKTRLGWDSKEENIEDFLLKLQDAGATMITLHGRTRKQGFAGKSDWEMIGKLKNLLEIPVIANGDIKNGEDALNCLKKTKADGVMIGRGILGSPWKIGEIDYAIREIKNFKEPKVVQKLYLIIEHLDELIKEKGDHGLLIARKHISWTCKDFKGASNLRNNLIRAVDKNEVKNLINKMIKTLNNEKNTLA